MKFTDIVDDLISEEVKNKGLLKFLMDRWYGDNLTQEQGEEIDYLLTKYQILKDTKRLQPQIPQVVTFLNRFRDFDDKNLTDGRHFSLIQMRFLIDDFFPREQETRVNDDYLPEILRGTPQSSTDERVEASKTLWYGQNPHLIIDEGDFRVYYIPNVTISMLFGYYEGKIREDLGGGMQWCVTQTGYNGSNGYWPSYRETHGRTFYFIIDETKNPNIVNNKNVSKFYLSSIQPVANSDGRYKITNIMNEGDADITAEEIISLYPKMRGHLDQLVNVEWDRNSEMPDTSDIIDRISERIGTQYSFVSQPMRIKKEYIERGRVIIEPLSWDSITPELKTLYIDLTRKETLMERFGKNLFDKIRENKQEYKSLARRVKILGFSGMGYLLSQYIKDDYSVWRVNSLNDNIMVVKTKRQRPERYGLWNGVKGDWYELNGVVYDDTYLDFDVDYNDEIEEGKIYLIEIYSKSSSPDNQSFISLIDINDPAKKGVLMTYPDYERMVADLGNKGQTQSPDQDDMDVDKYSEIKENEKGV